MKIAKIFSGLLLLLASPAALAQQSTDCPSLPANSGLRWEQQTQSDFIVCKAITEDGRAVLNMMLATRDPNLQLNRPQRAEKGEFAGESFYWYKLDMGGNETPELESHRITVVKLDKRRYAQIWIDAENPSELGAMQAMAESMNLNPSALIGSN